MRRKTRPITAAALPELAAAAEKASQRVKRVQPNLDKAKKAHTELTELYVVKADAKEAFRWANTHAFEKSAVR